MSIKSDHWIRRMAAGGMIEPFAPDQVRSVDGQKIISYGTSSYGYDVRCANEFKIFTNINSTIVDPKAFDPQSFVDLAADVCIIPPNSFALARTIEYFRIPRSVLTVCLGKSTYARCFSADTRVALVDGTTPTFEELARRADGGERFFGYSIAGDGELLVAEIEAPRFVGRDALVEIELDDGRTIRATPDHEFLRRDGRRAAAADLRPNDALMPLYRYAWRGQEMAYEPRSGRLAATDDLADEWNVRHRVYRAGEDTRREHVDGNPRNNQPTNLRRVALSAPLPERAPRAAVSPWRAGVRPGAAAAAGSTGAVRLHGAGVQRNHKVAGIRAVAGEHDVYCLTVPEAGNFALAAGVFVSNCGIIVNVTPLEPEWEGHVTLEFSNTTPLPAKIYANEGVAQMLFFESDEVCGTSYRDRGGKYQGQRGVTLPKT